MSMAIADAVLTAIEKENLQKHALEVGSYLIEKFQELKSAYPNYIGDVRGQGMFMGVEMIKDGVTKEANKELAVHLHRKLKSDYFIIMTNDGILDNVMKFKGPMVFTKENADYLVKCFGEILEDY